MWGWHMRAYKSRQTFQDIAQPWTLEEYEIE